MAEWSIEIDSDPGATTSEDQVLELERELADGGALAPVCSFDIRAGSVGAAYQVEASSFFDALHLGQSTWLAAMRRAGMPPSVRVYEQRPNGPARA